MAKTPTKRHTTTLTIGTREWVFSEAVIEHAEKLLNGDKITQTGRNVWTTKQARGDAKQHPVITTIMHTDPSNRFVFVSCTCTHGKQAGFGRARCSHVFAALTQLGATT